MKSLVPTTAAIAISLWITACAAPGTREQDPRADAGDVDTPGTAVEALASFYEQFDYDKPIAPPGPALPGSDTVLTSIAFGSCSSADRPIPILRTVGAGRHDLFLYIGDNVYGSSYSADAAIPELREAYHRMAGHPDFRHLRQRVPMLSTWDDHDYGVNDGGGSYAFKGFSEQLFLDFWGAEPGDVRRSRDGIHDAHIFGAEGRRVQIILLDTRYFRSDLTMTDERGAVGRERYLPSADPAQSMLGDAQWEWLEAELRKPAEVRLLVSSIQVHADGHGWEAWRTMPLERDRLYRLIGDTAARGVVLLSGDRHSSGLYVRDDVAPYPLYEITSSSLNRSIRDRNDEPGPHRIGEMYAPVNYGVIGLDWDARRIALEIRDLDGTVVREQIIGMDEIGVQ